MIGKWFGGRAKPDLKRARNLMADADRARDGRDWIEARQLYRDALDAGLREKAGIWVQLGHACKECGDLRGADAAYLKALQLAPDIADTHLQLGHLRKMQHRPDAAATEYVLALRLDPGLQAAFIEAEALGIDPAQIRDLADPSFALSPAEILLAVNRRQPEPPPPPPPPTDHGLSRIAAQAEASLDRLSSALSGAALDLASLYQSDAKQVDRLLKGVGGRLRLSPGQVPGLRSIETALITLALHAPTAERDSA